MVAEVGLWFGGLASLAGRDRGAGERTKEKATELGDFSLPATALYGDGAYAFCRFQPLPSRGFWTSADPFSRRSCLFADSATSFWLTVKKLRR